MFSVDRRSLARYSSCHGVLRDELHRRLQRWQENGVWGSVTYETAGAFSTVTGKLDLDVVAELTARWCPPPAAAATRAPTRRTVPNPAPNTRCWWTATACRWPCTRREPTPATNSNLETIIHKFPHIQGKPGTPQRTPRGRLGGSSRYDSEANRLLLRWLGIEPFIAKRRTEHGSGLGKFRWVAVERTNAWPKALQTYASAGTACPSFNTPSGTPLPYEHHLLSPLERILALTQTYNNSGFVRAFKAKASKVRSLRSPGTPYQHSTQASTNRRRNPPSQPSESRFVLAPHSLVPTPIPTREP